MALGDEKMSRVFIEKEIIMVNPVVLTTSNKGYSMSACVGLLKCLEGNGAVIPDSSWKFSQSDYGNLVEEGVTVEFEQVTFKVVCSYNQIYFHHIQGPKVNFWALCKLFSTTED